MPKAKMPTPPKPAAQKTAGRIVRAKILKPAAQIRTVRVKITPARPRRIGKLSTTKYALSNAEVLAARLKKALHELRAWRNKNAELAALSPELSEVFAAIKRTLKKHDDRR
jgi:hypothetical protein